MFTGVTSRLGSQKHGLVSTGEWGYEPRLSAGLSSQLRSPLGAGSPVPEACTHVFKVSESKPGPREPVWLSVTHPPYPHKGARKTTRTFTHSFSTRHRVHRRSRGGVGGLVERSLGPGHSHGSFWA